MRTAKRCARRLPHSPRRSIAQHRAAIADTDLEEAGLHTDAVADAHIGIALDERGWDQKLVTFVVGREAAC